MLRTQAVKTIMILVLVIAVLWPPSRVVAQIKPASDAPKPKLPDESAKCVRLPPGFKLELVASEPLIREPTAIAFDERGRLFVCEIHGYNLDGYLDIVELNKTGVLDREVRRVRHATEKSQAGAAKETYGTVRLLHDTDGDGRMDKVDVWADRLPPCYGLIAARGGVIVVCAPDIVFLADRDGDGKAEVRETLFTGFAREFIERGINNPRWGPDNWIYVASGGGGGEITGPRLQPSKKGTGPIPRNGPEGASQKLDLSPFSVRIGHSDFRIKPDGSAIEPVTGTEHMFGLTMTDFGDRFHTIVSFAVPLPFRYLARNPYVPSPEGDVSINSYRQIFPISQPDPWRLARGQDPAWVKFYGEAETRPNGQFTASSGQMIYRADALPESYRGNYFVCDPANNLVHRCLLERDGMIYSARRAPREERSEFLASTDQWFRPMNLMTGPDGAIYIVDMYREIIEDFSAIPRFLQQQYAESLIAGKDHGRIWRLVHSSPHASRAEAAAHRASSLHAASPVELVQHLAHSNAWWRETAQRLLVERGDKAARATLAQLVRNGATPQARMHALYTLDGLESSEPSDVLHALGDASYGVRQHALQLAEHWLDQRSRHAPRDAAAPRPSNAHPAILERVLGMVDDPDPRVRLQAAMTLGESRDPRTFDALARLAVEHGDERWMSAAIISSVAETADALTAKLLDHETLTPGSLTLLGLLAETVGARHDDTAVGRVLERISNRSGTRAAETQGNILDGLSRGLSRGKPNVRTSAAGVRGVERLLVSESPEVRQRALHIAGLLKLNESPAMHAAWDDASKTALDADCPLAARLAAVSLLAAAPWPRQARLAELLDARQPTELQRAVVETLARSDEPAVADALVANWPRLLPKAQDAVVDALFARHDRLPKLLDAVERGVVPAASLSALRREQLVEHSNLAIRRRARAVLSGRTSDDRAAVLRQYESALTLPRDAKRGAALFEKHCEKCHRLGNKGFEVGPDLTAARTRPDATLLSDVLDPSSTLTHGFTVYTVATHDGRVRTGLLAGESATSLLLRREKAETESILRKDIDEMRASSKSLMPDGFEKEVTPQDVVDLIGFLRESLGAVLPPGIVLFDDEREFVTALTDGGGVATLTETDKYSGEVALEMTPLQRSAARIPGWNFRIVEHVGRDTSTFRYLRFAWKSASAHGVMIELAASGG